MRIDRRLRTRGEGLLVAMVTLSFVLVSALASDQQKRHRKPVLLAHRGLVRHAPENTLPAFAAAIELGLAIELDVYQTSDGHLIVIHDETVDRTTDGQGAISEMTLSEVRQLDAGSWFDPVYAGLKVPLLEEVFELVHQSRRDPTPIALNMKIVPTGMEVKIVRLIEKYDLFDQLFAFGQSTESSQRFKQANARMRTTIVKIYDSQQFSKALESTYSDCLWVGFVPSREEVNRAHSGGKQVWLSLQIGQRRTDIWDQASLSGLDGICTDWPLECRRYWRGLDE